MLYLNHWLSKRLGEFIPGTCDVCGNYVLTELVKWRRWVTFLGFPLVPTSSAHYVYVCPACGVEEELARENLADARELQDATRAHAQPQTPAVNPGVAPTPAAAGGDYATTRPA